MWEVGQRGWISITVGIAADGVTGQGATGKDNEHKGLAGWNLAGLDWYFVIGLIFGLDFIVDRFGVYAAPLIMIGSNSIVPGIGFGLSFFRRVGFGVIVPFWMLGIIVPAIVAILGSAAVAIVLLIGLALLIVGAVRWIRNRSN